MDDVLYWLWLAEAVGSGCDYAGALLEEILHPARLYEQIRGGAPPPQALSLRALEKLRDSEAWDYTALYEECAARGIAILTPDDADYPDRMRTLPDRPLVLYATGDTSCLNGRRTVGMVGTRRPSAYGRQACYELSLELAKQGVVIVSGLADGLDSEGHKAAVAAGQATVAFLGTAIDKTYPAVNKRLREQIEALGGAVLSEYPPHYEGRVKGTFLARNRLIAAQSEALCVIEARSKSGTLNTVRHALRYQRPVLAMPGSIYSPLSEGTHELLHSGEATVLCRAADAMEAIGFAPCDGAGPASLTLRKAAPQPALSPDAQKVAAVLKPTPLCLDELGALTGLSAAALLAACMELELAGGLTALPGRRFTAR